jgi:hypothetical protein
VQLGNEEQRQRLAKAPGNSENLLSGVYRLARDCAQRQTLGPDVAIEIHPFAPAAAHARA